jgi:hypothetical protein
VIPDHAADFDGDHEPVMLPMLDRPHMNLEPRGQFLLGQQLVSGKDWRYRRWPMVAVVRKDWFHHARL